MLAKLTICLLCFLRCVNVLLTNPIWVVVTRMQVRIFFMVSSHICWILSESYVFFFLTESESYVYKSTRLKFENSHVNALKQREIVIGEVVTFSIPFHLNFYWQSLYVVIDWGAKCPSKKKKKGCQVKFFIFKMSGI